MAAKIEARIRVSPSNQLEQRAKTSLLTDGEALRRGKIKKLDRDKASVASRARLTTEVDSSPVVLGV